MQEFHRRIHRLIRGITFFALTFYHAGAFTSQTVGSGGIAGGFAGRGEEEAGEGGSSGTEVSLRIADKSETDALGGSRSGLERSVGKPGGGIFHSGASQSSGLNHTTGAQPCERTLRIIAPRQREAAGIESQSNISSIGG